MALWKEAIFWFILLIAAVFEVGGDALIRQGEKNKGWAFIIPGFIILGLYGVIINLLSGPDWLTNRLRFINLNIFRSLQLDVSFSMMLGVYVAVFALVSVVGDQLWGSKQVPLSTWLGLSIVCIGGLIIRYGNF